MTRWPGRLQLGLALYACGGFVACFEPGGSAGFATPDAGDMIRPTGGTGGGDGVAGIGSDPGGPVICPAMQCAPIDPNPMLASLFEPCCAPSGLCSLRSPGTECTELPEPDPRCGTLFVGKSELPGCCGPDGFTCGVNVDVIGLGCVTADMLAGFGFSVERRACAPADPDGDAGTDADAGL